jgi:hypothetical protein
MKSKDRLEVLVRLVKSFKSPKGIILSLVEFEITNGGLEEHG